MISQQVYCFILQAKTPLYFGSTEAEKLLTRANGEPIVSGNAIGGLLREWMKNNRHLLGIDPLDVMGDEETDTDTNRKVFRESTIQIDDGQITYKPKDGKFPEKKGNAIDPQTGTVRTGHFYDHQYIPAGTEIHFEVSCQFDDSSPHEKWTKEKLQELMTAWAAAMNQEVVRWGGKKSLRYGVCEVKSIKRKDIDFTSENAIDDYLFDRRSASEHPLQPTPLNDAPQIYKMRMEGSFPYGVYMPDFEKELSDKDDRGEQQVSIPSSSLKGLIRHEVRRLVWKILHHTDQKAVKEENIDDKVMEITNRLFGSTDQAGIIIFHDLQINGKEVCVKRPPNNEKEEFPYAPKYVKIDRITGGAVETQLRTQREVQGDGEIILEIRPPAHDDSFFEEDPIWFPLIYALRRIGAGLLPIAGRTSIGLGIFHANELRVEKTGDDPHTHTVQINGHHEAATTEWLRNSYNRFIQGVVYQ